VAVSILIAQFLWKTVFDGEVYRTLRTNEISRTIFSDKKEVKEKNRNVDGFFQHSGQVVPTIQNSNFFMDDLRNAAGLEDESYNPLPHDLT